jgi:hypothetical protein
MDLEQRVPAPDLRLHALLGLDLVEKAQGAAFHAVVLEADSDVTTTR